MSFADIAGLDYVTYLVWRRDAFIHLLSRTEAGQEYLDNAWRLEQTKPDRPKLRKKLGKEVPKDG